MTGFNGESALQNSLAYNANLAGIKVGAYPKGIKAHPRLHHHSRHLLPNLATLHPLPEGALHTISLPAALPPSSLCLQDRRHHVGRLFPAYRPRRSDSADHPRHSLPVPRALCAHMNLSPRRRLRAQPALVQSRGAPHARDGRPLGWRALQAWIVGDGERDGERSRVGSFTAQADSA